MDGVHSESLQVVDGFLFRQRQELSLVLDTRRGIDGEITMVHLVDDEVGRRLHNRPFVLLPSCGVGLLQVDDGSAHAIHTHSLGKDAWCPTKEGLIRERDM